MWYQSLSVSYRKKTLVCFFDTWPHEASRAWGPWTSRLGKHIGDFDNPGNQYGLAIWKKAFFSLDSGNVVISTEKGFYSAPKIISPSLSLGFAIGPVHFLSLHIRKSSPSPVLVSHSYMVIARWLWISSGSLKKGDLETSCIIHQSKNGELIPTWTFYFVKSEFRVIMKCFFSAG